MNKLGRAAEQRTHPDWGWHRLLTRRRAASDSAAKDLTILNYLYVRITCDTYVYLLFQVAKKLDAWIAGQNVAAISEGLPLLKSCKIRVMGQVALLESAVPLTLAATADVDVKADYEYSVEAHFRQLLEQVGKELDPLGHEIWMPRETTYRTLFRGELVTLQLADADAVLVSKAARAPVKNHALLVEYLAQGASPRFFTLCKKYSVDLEQFL